MVKSELIKDIADKIPALTDKDVELAVNALLKSITESLANGDRVELRGFGSFSTRYRDARTAHNPKTGEKVIAAPKYVPYFKAGKEMRDRINASRETTSIQAG